MPDIDLYRESADSYEKLQSMRPDYYSAQKAMSDLADIRLKGMSKINVADFCCGTGNNTKLIASKVSITKATLIDINGKFLELAKGSSIKAVTIETLNSDILDVTLKPDNDVVISMFAYHHVKDDDKERFINIAKSALKPGGILLLGEIYSPDRKTTLEYYKGLLDAIPANIRTSELERFIMQTAESHDFEFKVSKKFATDQLEKCDFVLLDSIKVWPKDNIFDPEVGTFVEAWQIKL